MKRVTSAVVLCVLSALAVGGCKKDEAEPQAIPISSGAPAAVTADPVPAGTAMAAPMDTAAAGTTTAVTPPPQPQANTGTGAAPTAPKAGASIDACCSALRAIASSGKSAVTKSKAASAAAVCPGIASRVKSGDTTRAAGLTQIRSALTGVTVPPECS